MAAKAWHEMTSEEFERSLKKSNITGMAAFNAGKKRRAAIKESGVDPDDPLPLSQSNGDGTITLVHPGGMNEIVDMDCYRHTLWHNSLKI